MPTRARVTLVTTEAAGAFSSPNVGDGITVTVSGLAIGGTNAANYSLAQPATTANITVKVLTVAGITAANKTYDGTTKATLALGGAALVGVVSGDAGRVSLITGSAAGSFASQNAGSGLTVAVSGLTLGGIRRRQLRADPANTSANIAPCPITIAASPQTKTYGTADPTFSWQITAGSLIGGDGITGSLPRAAGEHVGTYAIQQGSLTAGANYNLSYVGANLTILPAPLTITADNQAKVFAAALPTLTVSYSGFVNGDTAASLTTPPTPTTSAKASSSVSGNPYAIAVSGAKDNDYAISYVPGTLTVTPAPLAIAQPPGTAVVGNALSPGIKVALEDGSGNVLPAGGGTVMVTIAGAPPGGLLKGTATAGVAKGVASFNSLSFTTAGDYTLLFSDSLASDTTPVTLDLTVAKGATTIPAPTAVAAGYTYGKAISLSTTLKSTAPSSVPFTGTASLVRDDGTVLATAAMNVGGGGQVLLCGRTGVLYLHDPISRRRQSHGRTFSGLHLQFQPGGHQIGTQNIRLHALLRIAADVDGYRHLLQRAFHPAHGERHLL